MSRYLYCLVSSRIPHCSRLISFLRADSPRFPPISGGRGPGFAEALGGRLGKGKGKGSDQERAGHPRESTWRSQVFLHSQTLLARALD